MNNTDSQLNIVLHENQRHVHEHPAKNKVIKAGKRFGKTKWALFEICQAAGMKPNGVFWYIAPTYKQAKQIAWWELSWLLPSQFVKRSVETDLLKELINGSRIQLIGADNEDSLRGPKLDGVIFDEAAYIDHYTWSGIISGQLLGKDRESTGFAHFISSPNKKGKNWFTGFYEDTKKKEMAGDRDWAAFKYTIYDNPTLNKEEIGKMKDSTPDDVWNLEYMGEESDFAGQLYPEFDTKENIAVYTGRDTGFNFRSIDWGIAHPTVCLWATLEPLAKTIYITDEFVQTGMVINESCAKITERTGDKQINWTVIDPSTAKRNSQTGRSDALEFARNGINTVMADNRDRGYDVTKMFLKKRMLKIHPKCKNLIYALKNVQRGEDEGDDTTDCLRYLCLRIHDTINGMNKFDTPEQHVQMPQNSREMSLFDKRIFGEVIERTNPNSWILEEIA